MSSELVSVSTLYFVSSHLSDWRVEVSDNLSIHTQDNSPVYSICSNRCALTDIRVSVDTCLRYEYRAVFSD